MNYIIDANNLAGSLGILKERDFDKQLIKIIQDWLGEKQKIVVLVFDSLDPFGDRVSLGNLEVIYSPRDNYNKSADDKIIEIFRQWQLATHQKNGQVNYNLNIIKKLVKDDLVFVSNDTDLRQKVYDVKDEISEKIKIIWNDDFIELLNKRCTEEEDDEINRGLCDDEVDEINDELMRVWKKL